MAEIIALGGGGFSMEDSPALDLYILSQARKARPIVCFLPTASGDADSYVAKFYTAFSRLPCQPRHLSLFKTPPMDCERALLESNVIYVGGGNTKSMLALWREWEVDRLLRRAGEEGIILAGISAGAICWFEEGLTDSASKELSPLKCLGFLQGSCSPHFDGEAERRPSYLRLIAENTILPGYGIDDGCALHFSDGALKCAVASRPKAKAYRYRLEMKEVKEETIEPGYTSNENAT